METQAISTTPGPLDPPADLPVCIREVPGAADLIRRSGRWMGRSRWLTLGESEVASFGQATGEPRETVSASHVLALAGRLVPAVCPVTRRRFAVNYGLDEVRFFEQPAVGSQMRVAVRLLRSAEHVSTFTGSSSPRRTTQSVRFSRPR